MPRYSKPIDPKYIYTCKHCGSTVRLFGQCQPCLLRTIHATDVAAKSKHYEEYHLWAQRPY